MIESLKNLSDILKGAQQRAINLVCPMIAAFCTSISSISQETEKRASDCGALAENFLEVEDFEAYLKDLHHLAFDEDPLFDEDRKVLKENFVSYHPKALSSVSITDTLKNKISRLKQRKESTNHDSSPIEVARSIDSRSSMYSASSLMFQSPNMRKKGGTFFNSRPNSNQNSFQQQQQSRKGSETTVKHNIPRLSEQYGSLKRNSNRGATFLLSPTPKNAKNVETNSSNLLNKIRDHRKGKNSQKGVVSSNKKSLGGVGGGYASTTYHKKPVIYICDDKQEQEVKPVKPRCKLYYRTKLLSYLFQSRLFLGRKRNQRRDKQ